MPIVLILLCDLYPQIDFTNRPTYLPTNLLVLTFDDGPDSVDPMNAANTDNTRKVLDVLMQKGVHATFFINTNNYTDVTMDDEAKSYIQRMWREGHEIGNHTVHHAHLGIAGTPMDPGAATAADIEAEITGVADVLRRPDVLGSCAPHLTLFRAPYGEPYQPPNDTTPRYTLVAPIVARHAVEIGWALDTFDYNCTTNENGPGDPDCVYNNFITGVQTPGNGAYGIVLMHAVQPQTAAALPRILDYIQQHGFVLGTVEQVVRAKYGMGSADLVPNDGTGGTSDGGCNFTEPDGGTADAGVHHDGGGGTGGSGGGGTGGSGGNAATGASGGCSCQAGGRGSPNLSWLLLVLLLRRRQ
jgi:peptidoglycan/xylan/chitin deacetylase (PgdA/CDA1 family)